METNKRILLYGNSVILGTIGVSLGRDSQFEVTRLATPMKKTQKLDAVKTDILLFDLGTTRPGAVLSLLESNPALQLIGISPGINLVRVWNSQQLQEISMQELLELIEKI